MRSSHQDWLRSRAHLLNLREGRLPCLRWLPRIGDPLRPPCPAAIHNCWASLGDGRVRRDAPIVLKAGGNQGRWHDHDLHHGMADPPQNTTREMR